MSGDIRGVIRQALVTLLDCKPPDPLEFLADYFQKECESRGVSHVGHALAGLSPQHPHLEDILHSSYEALNQHPNDNDDCCLTGDVLTELMLVLLQSGPTNRRVPESHAERLLHLLGPAASEPVTYALFRAIVITCLLLRDFYGEVLDLYDDLCPHKRDLSRSLASAILNELHVSVSATSSDNPNSALEVSSSRLSLPQLCSLLAHEPDEVSSDGLKVEQFASDAIDIFFAQIPQLK